VRNPIELPFDVDKNIKVEDAILLAGGVTPDVAEYAYIKRKDIAKPKERKYIRVNLQNALLNPGSEDNIVLQPFDELRVYSKSSFLDDSDVAIDGAVRNPGSYAYDDSLQVSDLIFFANGLRIDAADFAYLIRTDPTNSQIDQYIRLDVSKIMDDPASAENIMLEPFDRITIYSKLSYTDEMNIKVSGAVREPGAFSYAETFTLKDALTLAGGLKLEASKSHVDVFRIILKDNEPNESIAATIEVDDSLNIISGATDDFQLMPFDHIVVRSIPDFDFQKIVTINGEVMYPGAYPILDENEKLLSIIQRSGGLTNRAFPSGATLYRSDGGTGYVVMDLVEVLKNSNSRYNFILKEGDVIEIPKVKELVTINGATRAVELYPDKIVEGGKFNVAYHKGKNAKWYVEKYAAGIGENGKSSLISVEHPNGELERTKTFLFFKNYPSVRNGSVVTVGVKPPKPEKEKEETEKEKVDWGKTLADSIAQATAILALVILIQQINR
jgi:polysaccharide biosynthesis/export protein